MKALALVLTLAACATPQQPAAARYPALPAAAATGAPAATGFVPGAGLTPLSLVCEPAERSVPNALDDDCNGSIDDGLAGPGAPGPTDAQADALVLALAYARSDRLQLTLRKDDQSSLSLTPTDCTMEQAFCTRRVVATELPSGHHELVVSLLGTSPAELPAPALVVSTQSHGKITTYLVPVTASPGGQVLGQLDIP